MTHSPGKPDGELPPPVHLPDQIPATIDVDKVVRTSVHETLVTLGMDAKNPLQLQQDMAFLREMRQAHQRIRSKGMLVMVGIVVTSLAAAVWLGIKAALHS